MAWSRRSGDRVGWEEGAGKRKHGFSYVLKQNRSIRFPPCETKPIDAHLTPPSRNHWRLALECFPTNRGGLDAPRARNKHLAILLLVEKIIRVSMPKVVCAPWTEHVFVIVSEFCLASVGCASGFGGARTHVWCAGGCIKLVSHKSWHSRISRICS